MKALQIWRLDFINCSMQQPLSLITGNLIIGKFFSSNGYAHVLTLVLMQFPVRFVLKCSFKIAPVKPQFSIKDLQNFGLFLILSCSSRHLPELSSS